MNELDKEALQDLKESILQYREYIEKIGSIGINASLLMYIRDDIQDLLEELEGKIDLKDFWLEVVSLDDILRENALIYLKEVGISKMKQYRDQVKPSKVRWWWYLDIISRKPLQDNIKKLKNIRTETIIDKTKNIVKGVIDWIKE